MRLKGLGFRVQNDTSNDVSIDNRKNNRNTSNHDSDKNNHHVLNTVRTDDKKQQKAYRLGLTP